MKEANVVSTLYSANAGARPRRGPAPTPPIPATIASRGGIPGIIDKLETLIVHETDLLRRNGAIDLKDCNYRKSQALLDLTRALRLFESVPMEQGVAARLKRLGASLEENRAVLKMHMEAIEQIAAIMADELRDAESDGTYARPGANAGPAR